MYDINIILFMLASRDQTAFFRFIKTDVSRFVMHTRFASYVKYSISVAA